jgi:hypothetical protein
MTHSVGAHELWYTTESKNWNLFIIIILYYRSTDQVDGCLILVLWPSMVQACWIVWLSIAKCVVNCYCELHLPVGFQVVQKSKIFERMLDRVAIFVLFFVLLNFPRLNYQSTFGEAFIIIKVHLLSENRLFCSNYLAHSGVNSADNGAKLRFLLKPLRISDGDL